MFRLLLTILTLIIALPAVAMPTCHDVAQVASVHHGAIAPEPASQTAHDCIGCIPPSNWLKPRLVARFAPAALPAPQRVARLDLGESGPPALPPPRIA